MEITKSLLTKPTKRRSGLLMPSVNFIVAHDTGNDGTTALQNVSFYKNPAFDTQTSAHIFVDDVSVIEIIPTGLTENVPPEKAWHVRYNIGIDKQVYGVYANDCALAFELCYFPNSVARTKKAYQNYVELFAKACTKYNLNPLTRLEPHSRLDPTLRTDPGNAFKYLGITWQVFVSDVVNAINAAKDPITLLEVPQSKLNRVKMYLQSIS